MIHSTKPAPFHHSWCMSSYKKTNKQFKLFSWICTFFLKSNLKQREMENSSLSYTASLQLPRLCSRPSNNYLFSCWKKCDNALIFPIYTQSFILIASQNTLKKNTETSLWTCGSLAFQKIIKIRTSPSCPQRNSPCSRQWKEEPETISRWNMIYPLMQCTPLILQAENSSCLISCKHSEHLFRWLRPAYLAKCKKVYVKGI